MRYWLLLLLFCWSVFAAAEGFDAEADFFKAYDHERFLSAEKANSLSAYQGYLRDCLAPCAYRGQGEAALLALVKQANTSAAYAEFLLLCPETCSVHGEAQALYQQRLQAEKTDVALFERAKRLNNEQAYQAYLNICTLCLQRPAAEQALSAIIETRLWQSLVNSQIIDEYKNYLSTCQVCAFRQEADDKLAGNVRIADNGLLQVRESVNGPWGLVCDDFFEVQELQVVARQLGVATCTILPKPKPIFFIGSDLLILLDDLGCSGNELTLTDCPHPAWGVHNCGKLEAVFLSCQ